MDLMRTSWGAVGLILLTIGCGHTQKELEAPGAPAETAAPDEIRRREEAANVRAEAAQRCRGSRGKMRWRGAKTSPETRRAESRIQEGLSEP